MTERSKSQKRIAMPLPLPQPIELFIASENTHDLEALADCFAAHATVRDEGQNQAGPEGDQSLEA
jgi:hypothetical protein